MLENGDVAIHIFTGVKYLVFESNGVKMVINGKIFFELTNNIETRLEKTECHPDDVIKYIKDSSLKKRVIGNKKSEPKKPEKGTKKKQTTKRSKSNKLKQTKEEFNEHVKIQTRKKRAEWRSKGLCNQCGARLPKGYKKTRCKKCIDKKSLYDIKRRGKWIAEGKCSKCGSNKTAYGFKMCNACIEAGRKYSAAFYGRLEETK